MAVGIIPAIASTARNDVDTWKKVVFEVGVRVYAGVGDGYGNAFSRGDLMGLVNSQVPKVPLIGSDSFSYVYVTRCSGVGGDSPGNERRRYSRYRQDQQRRSA
ncbi:hypothetical protein [Micromonospora costi]|uniref:hypothetical protein n=1 Tax=Micromonospora costi TaxID=1530042 RepID=UPI001F4E0C4C|nr:hypothetical protein [Micromonospora costi]